MLPVTCTGTDIWEHTSLTVTTARTFISSFCSTKSTHRCER